MELPPDFLQNYPPDVILLLNPISRPEGQRMVNELGIQAAITTV
jgi:hypothetical protein